MAHLRCCSPTLLLATSWVLYATEVAGSGLPTWTSSGSRALILRISTWVNHRQCLYTA